MVNTRKKAENSAKFRVMDKVSQESTLISKDNQTPLQHSVG